MSRIVLGNKNLNQWPSIPTNATDLRIENNQLIEIPDAVQSLNSLTRIIATNNKISKISKKLSSLPNFTDLRLANNELKAIPETIFSIKKLTILLVNNNNIEIIPPEIGFLKSLTQFHLQANQLNTVSDQIGGLSNLTHLNLDNNPIEYLPSSIRELKKLVHFSINGTNLPIPPGYQPNQNIPATIEYILANQREPPITLNIKNAFVFCNFSKVSLIDKFNSVLSEFSDKNNVEFSFIDDVKNLSKETTTVLLIVGFDVHNDPNLIFKIIKKCASLNIPYKILYQKDIEDGISDINLEKGAETKKLRDQFEENFYQELIQFHSQSELSDLILNVLKEHKPEVKLNYLGLINIGHFEDVEINFDKNLTCFVGENGFGKSSILRALALAIVGPDNSKIVKKSIDNLLRIKSINKDGQVIYSEKGSITLRYSVDSVQYENVITLSSKDEGRLISTTATGDYTLNSGEFNLKSLIVGFPQLRGRTNVKEDIKKTPYSQPHIDDIIPLLNNEEDLRLDSFVGWIANLYGEAIKDGEFENSKEASIIEYVFNVITELTGKNISFVTVQNFTPPIVIISTADSPNGVPLNLISQGFKIVIGWIGYFIQRRIEAFPLSSISSISTEKSILIIDEIDSSIHPIWQSRLLDVLRRQFPSTQIICTTHSPIMLAGLDKEQILEIRKLDDRIVVQPNSFDTWASSYKEILQMIFNTSDYIPKVSKEEIELELENEDNPEKITQLKETLNRLLTNEMLADNLKKYELTLSKKEKELDALISEYKVKNK
ncbi:MAG: AAA family ATPase [Bacteroidetes bacterium]|nr:AAA family ATPase [Bacteroidota bacterium]